MKHMLGSSAGHSPVHNGFPTAGTAPGSRLSVWQPDELPDVSGGRSGFGTGEREIRDLAR